MLIKCTCECEEGVGRVAAGGADKTGADRAKKADRACLLSVLHPPSSMEDITYKYHTLIWLSSPVKGGKADIIGLAARSQFPFLLFPQTFQPLCDVVCSKYFN